jgi:hypothetical protein
MLRWFVFTLAMGLLPFGFSALLQSLRGVPAHEWQRSPELLFFVVMVCAVQLGSIFETLSRRPGFGKRHRAGLEIAFGAFLIGAVVAAGLYGVYIDQERNALLCQAVGLGRQPAGLHAITPCAEWLSFQSNLYRFSIKSAGFVGCVGTVVELICTRRRL